jgi:hypothetical protein
MGNALVVGVVSGIAKIITKDSQRAKDRSQAKGRKASKKT